MVITQASKQYYIHLIEQLNFCNPDSLTVQACAQLDCWPLGGPGTRPLTITAYGFPSVHTHVCIHACQDTLSNLAAEGCRMSLSVPHNIPDI